MKIFHLSDLHIGLRLLNHDLREDQEYILDQIVSCASKEKPDAILIAGDIYDKAVPSADAVETFDRFVAGLSEALPDTVLMLISGNHDSGPRVNCFRSLLSRQNIYMVGLAPEQPEDHIEKVTLEDEYGPVHFYLLPFVRPSMVKGVVGLKENGNHYSYEETIRRLLDRETLNLKERNVLVSHQFYIPAGKTAEDFDSERTDSEIRMVGNVDSVPVSVLEAFDYAALGHIHKPLNMGDGRFRYCGTPLACSVSEAGQQKSIVMVEMAGKDHEGRTEQKISLLPLRPLRAVRRIKGPIREVLEQGCEDYVSVTLTDRDEDEYAGAHEKIRRAFPNLLEIRRDSLSIPEYTMNYKADRLPDPFELCCEFAADLDEEGRRILFDVIRTIQERE